MTNHEYDPSYSTVFHSFSFQFGLKAVSILLLSIIATYSKQGHSCWLSNESFAERTGSTKPTVIDHLRKLEKLGLIKREGKHSSGTHMWVLGSLGEEKLQEIQELLTESKRNKDEREKRLRKRGKEI